MGLTTTVNKKLAKLRKSTTGQQPKKEMINYQIRITLRRLLIKVFSFGIFFPKKIIEQIFDQSINRSENLNQIKKNVFFFFVSLIGKTQQN